MTKKIKKIIFLKEKTVEENKVIHIFGGRKLGENDLYTKLYTISTYFRKKHVREHLFLGEQKFWTGLPKI